MDQHESLTLTEAAKIAGVTLQTMRAWAKKMNNARQLEGGGWSVPRHELAAMIAEKRPQQLRRGASASRDSSTDSSPSVGSAKIEDLLRSQITDLRADLARTTDDLRQSREETRAAREDLRAARDEIDRLNKEIFEILRTQKNGGVVDIVSRFIPKRIKGNKS